MENEKKSPERLELAPTNKEGLKIGYQKSGKKYSVRDDRSRYFYPEEWNKFINEIRPQSQFIYETLLQTGGRIAEILHLKPSDVDFERNTMTLRVTKKRAKLGERMGKKRTFIISQTYSKHLKKYIKENNVALDQYLFTNNEGKQLGQKTVYLMMRRGLVKAGVEDYWNFSLHNIRKTTGNWLKALGVPAEEICLRLGHDFNTYLKHYGSATIFDRQDRIQMIKILGQMYNY